MLGTTLLVWTLALGLPDRCEPPDSRRGDHRCGPRRLLALTDPILALAVAGVAWAIWRAGSGTAIPWRRSLALVATMAIVALVGVSPGLCATSSSTGSSWRSKVRSAMRSGRETVRSAKGPTRSCGRRSTESWMRARRGAGFSGLNRTLWDARHEAGYLDDIALTRPTIDYSGRCRSRSGRGFFSCARWPTCTPTLAVTSGSVCAPAAVLHFLRRDQSQDAGAGLSAASPGADVLGAGSGSFWPGPDPQEARCRRS